jgi:hypothetical protein
MLSVELFDNLFSLIELFRKPMPTLWRNARAGLGLELLTTLKVLFSRFMSS